MLPTMFLIPVYPIEFVSTEIFKNSSLIYKIIYYNICVILIRIRYYVGNIFFNVKSTIL